MRNLYTLILCFFSFFCFPQKENRTFGGVYTNDYRNKKSLENTPDWGTKN